MLTPKRFSIASMPRRVRAAFIGSSMDETLAHREDETGGRGVTAASGERFRGIGLQADDRATRREDADPVRPPAERLACAVQATGVRVARGDVREELASTHRSGVGPS